MTTMRAAVYVRISSDPDGERAGVERQRAECLELVERNGWQLVQVYEDNDRSAYSGRPRPAFEQMMIDAAVGGFDVVVSWASDRLYRLIKDLTRITDELSPHARIVTVNGGDVDLATAEGIVRAQMLGSIGEFESRRKAERVRARATQRARVDGRMTASRRPFGWRWADPCPGGGQCEHQKTPCARPGDRPRSGSRAGLVIDETESVAVAAVLRLVAEGGSVRAASRWLNDHGHVGTTGKRFSPESTRGVLLNPRHAGLVAHRGEVVGDAADKQQIVPADLWRRVHNVLSDSSRRTSPGRPAETLLTGLLRCGRCDGPMSGSRKHSNGGWVADVYICSRNYHLTRRRDLVDPAVLRVVSFWIEANAEAVATFAAPAAGEGQLRAAEEVEQLTARLAALHELVAAGELDPVDYAESTRATRARLVKARARAVVASGRPALGRLVATGNVVDAWREMVSSGDRAAMRPVLAEILDRVVVSPPAVRGHPTDDDLTLNWADALAAAEISAGAA
jgi:hypothetical protein